MHQKRKLPFNEVLNTASHGFGVLASLLALVLLIVFSLGNKSLVSIASLVIYGISLVLMFVASTLYHSAKNAQVKHKLNIFDRLSIYILIAGTYTPFALVSLKGWLGWLVFGIIWALALAGIIYKLFFYNRKMRYISAFFYLGMGWMAVFFIKPLIERIPPAGIAWLVAGGAFYSIGIIFYISKKSKYFHFVWHLFVLAGAFCHFCAIFFHVL